MIRLNLGILRNNIKNSLKTYLLLHCKILAQQGTVSEVIIFEQINVNLSNDKNFLQTYL